MRDAAEGHADSFDGLIRLQPPFIAHPRINESQTAGKFVRVRIDRGIDAPQKCIQRLGRVAREIGRQKMIEENIRDHARVVAVLRNQHAAECGHRGMRIGEGIDAAVMTDSVGDAWRQIIADILGVELVTTNATEGPAFGAALLAGVACGVYPSVQKACEQTVRIVERTEPRPQMARVYGQAYETYKALYPALKPIISRPS